MLLALVATGVLLELGAAALVEIGVLETPRPSFRASGFWQGDHPDFGVWHRPDAEWVHATACYRVVYRTNSVGARDVERPRRARERRVVVLGDSFLEGWGVQSEQRLSNRLEVATGIPHLNFAMAHLGPYQELLVYEKLARGFDHDAVLIGLLPENDFVDLDLERAEAQRGYAYRYRPYLVGEPPDLTHLDHRESRLRRGLRRTSYAGNALLAALRGAPPPREAASETPHSTFYDFSERDVSRLEIILERLIGAAEGRPVAILLIPSPGDLKRYARDGADPLSARLAKLERHPGVRVVNLLQAMAEYTRGWRSYYLPCDYHWSVFGNKVAADLVHEALADGFYPPPG